MSQNITMTAPITGSHSIERKHFDLVALVDADRIKHLVCYDIYQLLQQNYPRHEIDIVSLIEHQLGRIHNMFSAKGIIFCFSGKSYNTFRYYTAIEKEYKGNRKNDATSYDCKSEDMLEIVRYIQSGNNTLLFADLEADDILSMLQCNQTFIVSNDKDLKQIPGLHFNPNNLQLENVTEETALRNLCYQMIIGDTTDNITGIKGLGPVAAEKLIGKYDIKSLPGRILFEYQTKFGITAGTDTFVENWNLIKLRLNRGDFFRQKYASAFNLLNLLLSK